MKRIFILLFISTVRICPILAQNDSIPSLGLRLNAHAFFDNKEFSGKFKKGYTLPGFILQPTLDYKNGNLYINAGIHAHYLAGADSTNTFLPILTISYAIRPQLQLTMGVLPYSTHDLPEQLYKPERVFMNLPNIGVEFSYKAPKLQTDVWINWERYIENGSPFQEEFMFGLVLGYKQPTFDQKGSLYANFYQIATHSGGQIDASDLPVTTISNTGVKLGCQFPLIKRTSLCAEVSCFSSLDASPIKHLAYENGKAIYANVAIIWDRARFNLGFWKAYKFINPRGEELFGSISTISSDYNKENRHLITSSYNYMYKFKSGFEIGFAAGMYVDLNKTLVENSESGTFEYFYTLSMKFNNRIYSLKAGPTY